jgi:hypothetical protein
MACIVDIIIMYGDYVRHVILFSPTREGVVKSGQPTDATMLVPDWLSPGFRFEALS